ncbi:hypothetical protein E2C01_055150 [Portunus trituberculatus]|uniref:Uncharacterized protein n=1 Tax=Portunus trituberculatus TaxID=210409 RepID=A0A5B7GV65_PORTR|nr:hypothetical protein [Portunus trituberculatus]
MRHRGSRPGVRGATATRYYRPHKTEPDAPDADGCLTHSPLGTYQATTTTTTPPVYLYLLPAAAYARRLHTHTHTHTPSSSSP